MEAIMADDLHDRIRELEQAVAMLMQQRDSMRNLDDRQFMEGLLQAAMAKVAEVKTAMHEGGSVNESASAGALP
jgi:hypothetical protein